MGVQVLVKLVFEDLNEFVDTYRGKLSLEGMELDLDDSYPEGTILDLNINLNNDLSLVHGKALVAFSTSHGDSFLSILRFLELDDASVEFIERMEERAIEVGVPSFDVEMALKEPGQKIPSPDDEATRRIDVRNSDLESKDVYSAVTSAMETPVEEEIADPVKKPRRAIPRFLLLFVIALFASLASVALVVFFFPGFLDESATLETVPEVIPTATVTAEVVPESGEPTPDITPEITPEKTSVPTVIPTVVPTVIPTVIPTQVPSPPPVSRAHVVRSVDWAVTDQRTIVTITGDGVFDEKLIRQSFLSNDPGPRYLVRLIDVGAEGVRFNTDVDGERLQRIRLWPHGEFDPPELYLVLDLARPDVAIEDIEFEGKSLVIRLIVPDTE